MGETTIVVLSLVAVSAVAFYLGRAFAPRLLPLILVAIAILFPAGIVAWLWLIFGGIGG